VIRNWFKNIGPGPLVAAAFIGPGTVTVCTISGVTHGFTLLWAMLLSIVATIVLQEMSARLGVISQKGLSEVIRTEISNPFFKILAVVLILSAIVIGNAAYEAGNISGGVLGLEALTGSTNEYGAMWSILIGVLAFVLLFIGNYKVLEKALILLVVLMSLAFLITAILTKPDLVLILKGLFTPNFSDDNILTVIALVGTTVVPYNLFLHASLVKEKWKNTSDLKHARKDTIIAVVLGGMVSMCIIISAAAIKDVEVTNAADLAKGLEPLFGNYAKYFLSIGLFAAGITSAITAPLAAAYVATGCLGWSSNMKSFKFRLVWVFILGLGVLFSSIGFKSIEIIKFAQIANGLLLPLIAGFLLWVMNKQSVLGTYKNAVIQNVFGALIFGIALFLGVKSILKVFDLL
jgi:manganese transport protein